MSRRNKSRNLLYSLRDRELGKVAPYQLSLNILSQLIRSNQTEFKDNFLKISSKPISYYIGHLYCNNYSETYTLHGHGCKPSDSYPLKPKNAKKKIIDVITYNSPVCKTFEDCKCENSPCTCASGFILCLTEDQWLCQFHLRTGKLIKEIYVKRINSKVKFKYCDWDVYASRIILTSGLNCDESNSSKSDVVVNMAVFTVSPPEFCALLEIKRSVFGKTCKHANVDDQLLILGMGYNRVHIYSFLEFLTQGNLCPYKIGENYSDLGKVGMHPTGLPLNFNIETAPPLLFNIESCGQTVCFGGFPYHCIYPKPKEQLRFVIQNLKYGGSKTTYIDSNVWNDEPNVVTFHPDQSNRIILRELSRVSIYDIKYCEEKLQLKESFCMDFQGPQVDKILPRVNSFGRRINQTINLPWSLSDRTVMAVGFEDELNLFGILGVYLNDPKQTGFINLYDSVTGDKLKSITLCHSLCDTNYYQLEIDREMLIIIEKDSKNVFRCFVYRLTMLDDIYVD